MGSCPLKKADIPQSKQYENNSPRVIFSQFGHFGVITAEIRAITRKVNLLDIYVTGKCRDGRLFDVEIREQNPEK